MALFSFISMWHGTHSNRHAGVLCRKPSVLGVVPGIMYDFHCMTTCSHPYVSYLCRTIENGISGLSRNRAVLPAIDPSLRHPILSRSRDMRPKALQIRGRGQRKRRKVTVQKSSRRKCRRPHLFHLCFHRRMSSLVHRPRSSPPQNLTIPIPMVSVASAYASSLRSCPQGPQKSWLWMPSCEIQ